MNRAKVTAEPGQPTMVIERMFDAPRDKVFAAMTQKDKLERWWIGPGYTNRGSNRLKSQACLNLGGVYLTLTCQPFC